MAFFLNFFGSFKKSAQELKSVRCIAVTAVLIALACILKTLTIQPMPTLKIGFAFVAIASIGMLYGRRYGRYRLSHLQPAAGILTAVHAG